MVKKWLNVITYLCVITTFLLACSKNSGTSEIRQTDSLNALKKAKTDTIPVYDSIEGKNTYNSKCLVCHQENGMGVPGTFPPLANSDYLLADKMRAIKQVTSGAKDSIIVNGIVYKGNRMPDIELTDQQLKDVVNYILNSWGNNAGYVTLEEVRSVSR